MVTHASRVPMTRVLQSGEGGCRASRSKTRRSLGDVRPRQIPSNRIIGFTVRAQSPPRLEPVGPPDSGGLRGSSATSSETARRCAPDRLGSNTTLVLTVALCARAHTHGHARVHTNARATPPPIYTCTHARTSFLFRKHQKIRYTRPLLPQTHRELP